MKDKLRDRLAGVLSLGNSAKTLIEYASAGEKALRLLPELLFILDAEGDGGAVAEVVRNESGQVYLKWAAKKSIANFIGTKLYTHPARSGVVSDEDVRDAERYRWLLKTVNTDCAYQSLEDKAWYALHNSSAEEITNAIDAAIQGERHER